PAYLELPAHGFRRGRARGTAEDRIHGPGYGAAVRKIDLDTLREEGIGIRIAILNDLQTAREGERLRTRERLRSRGLAAERTQSETYSADILKTEPSVIGCHRLRNRAVDQPRGQRRDSETAPNNPLGGHPVLRDQALQGVDAAMCCAPAGKRLAAEFG